MNTIRLSQENFKILMEEKGIDDNTVRSSKDYFICINATGAKHSIPYFTQNHNNVINLYFDDVETSGPKEIEWLNGTTKIIDAVAMNQDQANELSNFIDNIIPGSDVYIYCAKGVSRSGAVEQYIRSLNSHVLEESSGINNHVYKLLRQIKDARL